MNLVSNQCIKPVLVEFPIVVSDPLVEAEELLVLVGEVDLNRVFGFLVIQEEFGGQSDEEKFLF